MGWRSFAVGLLTVPLFTGCLSVGLGLGTTFEDSLRFHVRPDSLQSVEPVAKVNERLYGFYLFGFRVAAVDPEELREEYLQNPKHRIVNWQVASSTIEPLLLEVFFTIPYAQVTFDVVEVD